MLDRVHDVIRALARYREVFDPRTGSIVVTGQRGGYAGDGFRPGFVAGIEERAELVRRLRRLKSRERTLLYLWYVEGRPVVDIARRLSVSRMHCYRLAKRALFEMTEADDQPGRAQPVANGSRWTT